jgi:hypothetical protein
MKTQRQTFSQIMEPLARRYGVSSVFSDFLTLLLCAFSHGQREDEYLSTIRRYEKPEAYRISEALGALVVEMTGDGSGMVDVLGSYFEEHISHGHNGQFFTPQHICDLIARMMNPVETLHRIADPACGSGRMLLAMAKLNRHARFYGADNDANCAKMTAINLCLNNLYGEVAWMNTLTQQWYGGWAIEPTIHVMPRVRQIAVHESYIKLKSQPLPQPQTKPSQLIFEF